jgi:hypothetical protein
MFSTNYALAMLVSCFGTLTVHVIGSQSLSMTRSSRFELLDLQGAAVGSRSQKLLNGLHKDSFSEKQKASLVGTKVLNHLKSIKIPKDIAVESSNEFVPATLSGSHQSLPKTEEKLMSAISAPAPKTDLMPESSYASGAKLAEDSTVQLPGVHVRSERFGFILIMAVL